ncbi:hypothetical protein SD70_18550 [Gordoniibacillus kamchatkensis]|uniref:Uncharacterized protein n=1 Tax=Gordoniibacillus kamchatkensis TaxID=1590651 RepID=A0ABR5AG15_9BACL|nr:hypothetical protein [Paenibacillus sp. VKM B-2647]KIL39648.1 hypothetical protein SD70_18550 [Paenibacillus sp. VKM B-2647]
MEAESSSRWIAALPFVVVFFIVTGMAGGYMDVWWHLKGLVETFATIPHLIIYASVFLGGMATLLVVARELVKIGAFAPARIPHAAGLALAGTGSLLELIAGITDNLYHNLVGFDVTLWSPPHLLVIYGGVVNALGVAELFRQSPNRRIARIGAIAAYGIAVSFFQFGMTEYDVDTGWAIGARWSRYSGYYAILIMPVLVFVVKEGLLRFGKPIGTWATLVPFVFKLIVYGVWSLTTVHMLFPFLLVLAGILFDLVYALLRAKPVYAEYGGVLAMAIGLTVAAALQDPLGMSREHVVLSLLGSWLAGAAVLRIRRGTRGRKEEAGHA